MLQKNPLCPPPPPRSRPAVGERHGREHAGCAGAASRPFVSPEDFDGTGILAGVDPCESRYWWLPDTAATGGGAERRGQATSASRVGTTADA
ncbi:MAG: hypothetical protein ACKOSQ_10600 [Planctomycetaceae bacterium]